MLKKILYIIQIFLFFCCSKNIEILKPQSSNVYTYQFSSSFVLNKNYFVSQSFGTKDFLLFVFNRNVFVHKISINQLILNKYDQIQRIAIYTNKGFLGTYSVENVVLNQKINFCLIVVDSTQNQRTTKFYWSHNSIALFFDRLNRPIAIKDIQFWANDTTKIQMSCLRGNNSKNIFEKYARKIVNKQANYRTFYSGNFGIAAFCQGNNSDTFYISLTNEKKFLLKRFVFYRNKTKIDTINLTIAKKNNQIEISKVGKFYIDVADTVFVDLATLDTNFIIDIKYATSNNFTGKKIYPCAKALLRYGAAKDLVQAQQELLSKGYRLKILDAYRPLSAQYVLWEAKPNINYVAPPSKGSIHNRGAAIDVTITDLLANELDMGTSYDFFGIEAFSDYINFSDEIIQNRQLLHSTLQNYNFMPIRTEWWHLSHKTALLYPLEDFSLPCE